MGVVEEVEKREAPCVIHALLGEDRMMESILPRIVVTSFPGIASLNDTEETLATGRDAVSRYCRQQSACDVVSRMLRGNAKHNGVSGSTSHACRRMLLLIQHSCFHLETVGTRASVADEERPPLERTVVTGLLANCLTWQYIHFHGDTITYYRAIHLSGDRRASIVAVSQKSLLTNIHAWAKQQHCHGAQE